MEARLAMRARHAAAAAATLACLPASASDLPGAPLRALQGGPGGGFGGPGAVVKGRVFCIAAPLSWRPELAGRELPWRLACSACSALLCRCRCRRCALASKCFFASPLLSCTSWVLPPLPPQGIIHRDIKSNNIFCSRHGILKLGDFGISKARFWGLFSLFLLFYTLPHGNT